MGRTSGVSTNSSAEALARAAREAAERAAKAAAERAARLAEAAKQAVAAKLSGKLDGFETAPQQAVTNRPQVDSFQPAVTASMSSLRDTSFDAIDSKLAAAQTEFDDSKSKVDALNKKLSQQLGKLGPGLTDEQKKAYIKQFRDENAGEYQRYEAATKQLGEVLTEAGTLDDMPPATTLRAMTAAKALAATPEGATAAKDFAVQVAKKLEANPGYFKGGLNNLSADQAERELNEIVSTAVPNLYANELRLANGDPKAAGNALAVQLEGIERLRVFSSSAEPIKKGIEALQTGDFAALKTLDRGNLFGKSFQAAGVALGIAKLASGADLSAQDYLQTLAAVGKDGTELIAMGMKALSSTSKIAASVSDALETGWAARLAPGLGVAANALQTSLDYAKASSPDGNHGDYIAVAGDALATAGSVLALTGVGEVAALPMQIIGTGIGKVGNMMSDSINHERDVAEAKTRLLAIGLSEEQAEQLARADPGALQVLSSRYGPEQLRELLVRNPNAFTSEYAAREYLAISQRTAGYPYARG